MFENMYDYMFSLTSYIKGISKININWPTMTLHNWVHFSFPLHENFKNIKERQT